MIQKILIALLALAWFATTSSASATTRFCSSVDIDCVPRIQTVYAAQNSDLSDPMYSSFYLVSYGSSTTSSQVTPDDGAAGLFVRNNANCLKTLDNGGSILVDNHTSGYDCFYRQNLSGDLRQWGITLGSGYDATYAYLHNTAVSDATDRVNAAFKALTAASITVSPPSIPQRNITELNTHQVSIYFGSRSPLPADNPIGADVDKAGIYGS